MKSDWNKGNLILVIDTTQVSEPEKVVNEIKEKIEERFLEAIEKGDVPKEDYFRTEVPQAFGGKITGIVMKVSAEAGKYFCEKILPEIKKSGVRTKCPDSVFHLLKFLEIGGYILIITSP